MLNKPILCLCMIANDMLRLRTQFLSQWCAHNHHGHVHLTPSPMIEWHVMMVRFTWPAQCKRARIVCPSFKALLYLHIYMCVCIYIFVWSWIAWPFSGQVMIVILVRAWLSTWPCVALLALLSCRMPMMTMTWASAVRCMLSRSRRYIRSRAVHWSVHRSVHLSCLLPRPAVSSGHGTMEPHGYPRTPKLCINIMLTYIECWQHIWL